MRWVRTASRSSPEGGRFIPGIDLGLVAEFLRFSYDPEPALPVNVLMARLGHTLATATRLTAQIPCDQPVRQAA